MGFVEQSLSSGERIELKARLHWGMFINPLLGLGSAFLCIILAAVPFVLSYDAFRNFSIANYGIPFSGSDLKINEADFNVLKPAFGYLLALFVALWILSGILNLIRHIATYFTTEFAVTNKRVIGKSGALRRRSLEVMLSKIESVSVDEPFWGRIFNYGTIVVKGSGGTAQPFPFIANAMGLRMQINNLIPPSGQTEGG
jgi:uncharacterized membrane protein YdbT with pleckstrin-like domain